MVDDNEIWWSLHRSDLAAEVTLIRGRQPDANSSSAIRTPNAAPTAKPTMPYYASFLMKSIKIGVVAGPNYMAGDASRNTHVPHDVAIWIENADFQGRDYRLTFLASPFAQQALGCESRRRVVVLMR